MKNSKSSGRENTWIYK